jgi:hypothetical protein
MWNILPVATTASAPLGKACAGLACEFPVRHIFLWFVPGKTENTRKPSQQKQKQPMSVREEPEHVLRQFGKEAPRLTRWYHLLGAITLVDCRAAPVDWTVTETMGETMAMLSVFCCNADDDGVLVPGCVHAFMPQFCDIIHANRGWMSLPDNVYMHAEEPIYACAALLHRVSQYADVDWSTSDIVMLNTHDRDKLATHWFETMLVQYRPPYAPARIPDHIVKMLGRHERALNGEYRGEPWLTPD